MNPEIGDICLFTYAEGQVLPAIIVAINEDKTINLQVFTNNSNGVTFCDSRPQGKEVGSWHFPVFELDLLPDTGL